MTRFITHLAVLATLAAAAAGCGTVRVTQPVGDMPALLDPDVWNGTWCDPSYLVPPQVADPDPKDSSYCVEIAVVDPARGVADVVDGESHDILRVHVRHIAGPQPHASEAGPLYVTAADGDTLVFVMRLERHQNVIVGWNVVSGAFEREIEAGRMRGETLDGDTVLVDATDAPTLRRIADDEHDLFRWVEPAVLVRCARP